MKGIITTFLTLVTPIKPKRMAQGGLGNHNRYVVINVVNIKWFNVEK